MSEELKPCEGEVGPDPTGREGDTAFYLLEDFVIKSRHVKNEIGNEKYFALRDFLNLYLPQDETDAAGVVEALEGLLKVWSDIPDETVKEYPEGHMVIKARAELKAYKEQLGERV